MPRITRAEPVVRENIVQANPGAANQGGALAIAQELSNIGTQVQSADPGASSRAIGELISRESRKYFEESRKAHQTGQLSNAISEATKAFQASKIDRESRLTDDRGNPLFNTLSQDVGKIGQDVIDRVSANIADEEVKKKFREDFSRYVANQQISSLSLARKQQIDYTRGSVQSGLDTLLEQGITDGVNNVGYYELKGQELLDDALSSGAMSFQEYERESSRFSEAVRVGSIQSVIEAGGIEEAEALLSKSSEALGISNDSKSNLDRTLQGKKNAIQRQAEAARREAESQEKINRSLLYNDLKMRIETGELTEDQLIREQPNLDPIAYQKLSHDFIKKVRDESEANKTLVEISSSISNGQSAAKYSTKDINEHYSRILDAVQEDTGEPVTMQQKAQVAAMYRSRVPEFSKELNANILYGNAEDAAEAVLAYTYSRDAHSVTLSGNDFTNQARDMAEYVEFLHTKASIPINEAVARARERFNDRNSETLKTREREFSKFDEFNSSNLLSTAQEDLDLDGFLGFFSSGITDEAAMTYKQLVSDAYSKTGDLDGAKELAKSRMSKVYAISTFNGERTYMANPPEMLFPGLDTAEFRAQFNDEIKDILPPNILDVNSVRIRSDALTRGKFSVFNDPETGQESRVEVPSYAITYTKSIGDSSVELPLVDPETGELVRWIPDVGKMMQSKIDKVKQKDLELRERKQNAGPGNIFQNYIPTDETPNVFKNIPKAP